MTDKKELREIEKLHETIAEETEKIEEVERRIDREEKEILTIEKDILKTLERHPVKTLILRGLTTRDVSYLRSLLVRNLRGIDIFLLFLRL